MDQARLVVDITARETDEYPSNTWQIATVHIDRIVKNSTTDRLQAGDSLEILEPIERFPRKFRTDTQVYGAYTELCCDARYRLFLNWNASEGVYEISGLEQGKVNLDGLDSQEADQLESNPIAKQVHEAIITSEQEQN